jgi:hypothetical protein
MAEEPFLARPVAAGSCENFSNGRGDFPTPSSGTDG